MSLFAGQMNTAPLSSAVTMQNAATATGVGTVLPTNGEGVAVIAISGTFNATITFQGQASDGNWYTINALQRGAGSVATTTTTTGLFEINCRGLSAVRTNITAYTSGSVTCTGQAQPLSTGTEFLTLSGSNALIGNYSTTFGASAAANTTQTIAVPLPSGFQGEAMYLVSVNNPSGLASSITVKFNNMVNFGGGNTASTVTSVDVASGAVKSYLVQGWLLGDAAAQIAVSNDAAASASGGTVQIQVRKV